MGQTLDQQVRPDRPPQLVERGPWLILVLLAVIVLWLRPIGSSFWLDETGTYWVIKDSLAETIDRAWRFQGQTPAYYVIAWFARFVGGPSEIALRLPSVLATATATFLVYRLGHRMFDHGTGVLSAIIFASLGNVAYIAIDARPYAFALLALTASTVMLVRLLEQGGVERAIAYALSVAGTVYLHYLFALGFVAHVAYVVALSVKQPARPKLRYMGMALGTIVLLLAPLVPRVIDLWSRRQQLFIPVLSNSVEALVAILVPSTLAAGFLLGIVLALTTTAVSFRRPVAAPGAAPLAATWAIGPPILLFAVAQLPFFSVLSPAYARSALPGLALLVGWIIRGLEPPPARRIVTSVVVILSLLLSGGRWHDQEDWRGAAEAVNGLIDDPRTPVLVHPAFTESRLIELFDNPEQRSWLLAPLSRYPVAGKVIPLPYDFNRESEAYLEQVVRNDLSEASRFILLTRYPFVPYHRWLDGRLRADGFESRDAGNFGIIQVVVFTKTRA